MQLPSFTCFPTMQFSLSFIKFKNIIFSDIHLKVGLFDTNL